MIWTGHCEEKSEKNERDIIIRTDNRNKNDRWLRNREKMYNKRGYRVKIRFIDMERKDNA